MVGLVLNAVALLQPKRRTEVMWVRIPLSWYFVFVNCVKSSIDIGEIAYIG